MKLLHFWTILLCLVSGLAGFAAGELRNASAVETSGGRFKLYSDRMTVEFDLSPKREGHLRSLVELYERELEDLKSTHLSTLEPKLVKLGNTYRGRIRNYVLPPDKRRAFDELIAGDLPAKDN
jgi:hypothetical protein